MSDGTRGRIRDLENRVAALEQRLAALEPNPATLPWRYEPWTPIGPGPARLGEDRR